MVVRVAHCREAIPMQDDFPVEAVDYVHFAVGNAKQAAHYYSTAFGMRVTAYRGPETGHRDTADYVLESGAARFVISGEVHSGTRIGEHVRAHGDGVIDVALRVPDATRAYEVAVDRGAAGLQTPEIQEDEGGKVVVSAIRTYGETRHTFVERKDYSGVFLPGFAPREPIVAPPGKRLFPPGAPPGGADRRAAGQAVLPGDRPRRRQRRARPHGRVGALLQPRHG